MPKASVIQTGFHTGEISPLCYGVTDNPRYRKGLEIGLNYLPALQGPVMRRPGTKYVNNVKDSANPPVLIPFKFSVSQNYMLEFGDKYIRFFANEGQVISPADYYQIAGALGGSDTPSIFNHTFFYATRENQNPQSNEVFNSPVLVTAGSVLEIGSPYAVADLPLLRWSQNGDTLYLSHPKYPLIKLQRQTQVAWKLQIVWALDGPYLPANSYLSIGDNANTIAVPLDTDPNFSNVTFGVIGGNITAIIAGTGGQMQVTTASAHKLSNGSKVFIANCVGTTEANNFSTFTTRISATPAPYWVVEVIDSTNFLLLDSVFTNAYGGSGQVTYAVFANSGDHIKPGADGWVPDFGRLMALTIAGVRYWGYIEIIHDAATVQLAMGGADINTPVPFPSTADATLWYLGVYGGQGPGALFNGTGYPECSAIHQNRLWLAGAANTPQQVDSSNSLNFEVFAPSDPTTLDVADDNSCSFVLSSDDSNALRWMSSTAQGLLAGSASAEWAMTPSGNSEALTPTNFNAQQTSFYGSAPIPPTKIGNAIMYVQNAARKLRELAYFFSAGTFRSSDLTEISEHITLPSLSQIDVQKETQPLIWGRRSDGVLTTLVYNRDDVSLSAGWMRHILGGKSAVDGTAAKVLSIGIIPNPSITFDQLWMIVQRYINGATICTVEYMTKIFDDSIAQADAFQFDCGSTYSGSPAQTISGLTWLVGETVGVLADGGIHPDCVVDNTGAIKLNYPASKVQVGYRYKSQGKLLRAEAGAADGTSIGKTRRTSRVAIQLYRTGELAIGTEFNNLIEVQFAQADQNQADTAPPLFSGIIREGLESAYDFESQLCFEQSSGLPSTIQSITSFMEEFDL